MKISICVCNVQCLDFEKALIKLTKYYFDKRGNTTNLIFQTNNSVNIACEGLHGVKRKDNRANLMKKKSRKFVVTGN